MSFIAELQVSLNKAEEFALREQGFKKIFVNLNEGAGGNFVYLWYKKGDHAITRIQISFNDEMSMGLSSAGFKKIDKNLNEGAGGGPVYLWYYKGSLKYDVPIRKLDLSVQAADEPYKYKLGWERLACDLNRGAGGNWIYLWLKRENPTYICDIKATAKFEEDEDNFNDGYIRVDEDTNRGAGGPYIFIWYRQTTDPKDAISELEISSGDVEQKSLQDQGYEIVNQDLNEGTEGKEVFLWYKKDSGSTPIKAITVLADPAAKQAYENDGLKVNPENLNTGNPRAAPVYLCYHK
ncbi:uncharacterized protein LOC116314927 [Oreochromis aureus]|uniref:uncharacterized protein LOC116314927 n=1 Tax=Oreochromis aureus TaxID=47969 RepID=UPI0019534F85|nr:uncharacterized protein LOC116314927 [Oreochromis aureus]